MKFLVRIEDECTRYKEMPRYEIVYAKSYEEVARIYDGVLITTSKDVVHFETYETADGYIEIIGL